VERRRERRRRKCAANPFIRTVLCAPAGSGHRILIADRAGMADHLNKLMIHDPRRADHKRAAALYTAGQSADTRESPRM
jgi:hypothetical protein